MGQGGKFVKITDLKFLAPLSAVWLNPDTDFKFFHARMLEQVWKCARYLHSAIIFNKKVKYESG
jgi:hypothetical protein